MPKPTLAIALCRVSSLEQLDSNSLSHQRDNVLKAADQLGVTIPEDGIWSGHVSSKKGVNYDRRDLREMLDYCRKHSNVRYLIVQEVDRFMRSPDEQVYFQVKFMNEVNVKIWYADKPELNSDDIYAGLMRYMEGFRAAGSNDERQRKSINGQTKALEEGRFPFSPKPGYIRGTEPGIQIPHPIKGPLLRASLLSIANHIATPTQALVDLNKSSFTSNRSLYKMDKFRKIITDPFYAGIVEIDKQVKVRNINGLHEPLISIDQHNELVRIMCGKKKTQLGPRKNGNDSFPLSNLVSCSKCTDETNGRLVGLNLTNGKQGSRIYEKYRCRACKRYLSKQELHDEVMAQFKNNPISSESRDELVLALKDAWKHQRLQLEQETTRLEEKAKRLTCTIGNQVEAATDPENISIKKDILSLIQTKRSELDDLLNEIDNLTKDADSDWEEFLDFAYRFVDDMSSMFLDTELVSQENRKRCKQVMFPAGFVVDEDKKVYTPEVSLLVRLAANKKDLPETEKSSLVRVQGL